jgi:hypothetical protein
MTQIPLLLHLQVTVQLPRRRRLNRTADKEIEKSSRRLGFNVFDKQFARQITNIQVLVISMYLLLLFLKNIMFSHFH